MATRLSTVLFLPTLLGAALASSAATAQGTATQGPVGLTPVEETAPTSMEELLIDSGAVDAAQVTEGQIAEGQEVADQAAAEPPSPDEMAASLNAQQSISQDVVITRRVNGQVVETTRRTVSFDRGRPIRGTEAAVSLIDQVKASYDRELLTRPEAFSEGKVNFALGDKNLDKILSEDEFVRLMTLLKDNGEDALNGGARSKRSDFIAQLDEAAARKTFKALEARDYRPPLFVEGVEVPRTDQTPLDERKFVLAFLEEFDKADANKDGLLEHAELEAFRNAVLGWTNL